MKSNSVLPVVFSLTSEKLRPRMASNLTLCLPGLPNVVLMERQRSRQAAPACPDMIQIQKIPNDCLDIGVKDKGH